MPVLSAPPRSVSWTSHVDDPGPPGPGGSRSLSRNQWRRPPRGVRADEPAADLAYLASLARWRLGRLESPQLSECYSQRHRRGPERRYASRAVRHRHWWSGIAQLAAGTQRRLVRLVPNGQPGTWRRPYGRTQCGWSARNLSDSE